MRLLGASILVKWYIGRGLWTTQEYLEIQYYYYYREQGCQHQAGVNLNQGTALWNSAQSLKFTALLKHGHVLLQGVLWIK